MKSLKDHAAFLCILAVNVAVFIACAFKPGLMKWLALRPELNSLTLLRVITSMFDHAGFGHIFGNMLFVAPFALYLEPKIGSRRFAVAWMLCGIAATLCFVMTPSLVSWHGLLGASGACFGICALALLSVDEHPLFTGLALFALLALAYQEYSLTVIGLMFSTGVAHAAHFGGFLMAGYLKGKDAR